MFGCCGLRSLVLLFFLACFVVVQFQVTADDATDYLLTNCVHNKGNGVILNGDSNRSCEKNFTTLIELTNVADKTIVIGVQCSQVGDTDAWVEYTFGNCPPIKFYSNCNFSFNELTSTVGSGFKLVLKQNVGFSLQQESDTSLSSACQPFQNTADNIFELQVVRLASAGKSGILLQSIDSTLQTIKFVQLHHQETISELPPTTVTSITPNTVKPTAALEATTTQSIIVESGNNETTFSLSPSQVSTDGSSVTKDVVNSFFADTTNLIMVAAGAALLVFIVAVVVIVVVCCRRCKKKTKKHEKAHQKYLTMEKEEVVDKADTGDTNSLTKNKNATGPGQSADTFSPQVVADSIPTPPPAPVNLQITKEGTQYANLQALGGG